MSLVRGVSRCDRQFRCVIFSLRALEEGRSAQQTFGRGAKTFLSTSTRKPERTNEARQILLSDESVAAICTQEILEHSHQNDAEPFERRDPTVMPLLFYDWRGEEVDLRLRRKSPWRFKND